MQRQQLQWRNVKIDEGENSYSEVNAKAGKGEKAAITVRKVLQVLKKADKKKAKTLI